MADQACWKPDEYYRVIGNLPPHFLDVRTIIHADAQDFVRIRDNWREANTGGTEFFAPRLLLQLAISTRRYQGPKIRKAFSKTVAGLPYAVIGSEPIGQTTIVFKTD